MCVFTNSTKVFKLCHDRSGTEEELNEKIRLLQDVSDQQVEGKRMARLRQQQRHKHAAALAKQQEQQQQRAPKVEALDARIAAMRAGNIWIDGSAWNKGGVMPDNISYAFFFVTRRMPAARRMICPRRTSTMKQVMARPSHPKKKEKRKYMTSVINRNSCK